MINRGMFSVVMLLVVVLSTGAAWAGPVGPEFRVNTYTTNSQSSPSVGMNDSGDFVIAWQSSGQDGDSGGVYAQRFDALGNTQGVEFQVNSYTLGHQFSPVVSMDGRGDFVIAWVTHSAYDVYARCYTSSGWAKGDEFQVNTHMTWSQMFPTVAVDASGDFVVSWTSDDLDGDIRGVAAQRYNALGWARGIEFQVNTCTTGGQAFSSVAMDPIGNFAIVWSSSGQDGSDGGIYAQRYDRSGVAQGGEFQVNTYTTGDQRRPAVEMDETGNFVVAWMSDGQDGDKYGVYAQRFNAVGIAQGDEFQVNTYTAGSQERPSVGMGA